MPQQPLDYRAPIGRRPSVARIIMCIVLILLGLPVILYGLIGAAFVEGAVEQGDPSASRAGVFLLLAFAAGGITMIVLGIVGLTGKAAT